MDTIGGHGLRDQNNIENEQIDVKLLQLIFIKFLRSSLQQFAMKFTFRKIRIHNMTRGIWIANQQGDFNAKSIPDTPSEINSKYCSKNSFQIVRALWLKCK